MSEPSPQGAPEVAWEDRGELAREGLRPLHFLVGTWTGGGAGHEGPLKATLSASLCVEDTVLMVREQNQDARGELVYEDLSLYRYDPVARQLKVLQVTAPAWLTEQLVVAEPWGCRWYAGPFAPQVVLRLDDAGALRVEVWEPEAARPAQVVSYRRA